MKPHASKPLKVTFTRYHPERFFRTITQLSDFFSLVESVACTINPCLPVYLTKQ